MEKSFLSRYAVDEVPIYWKPLFYLYGYGSATLGFVYFLLVHFTSKISIIGRENLVKDSNYIFCFWHQNIFLYFAVFLRNRNQVWMQHASWFLKPSHVLLRFIGVEKIVLGSTGHSGKKAADHLVEYLKKGYSTVLLPDGPSGPAFQMKKGALHISLQSNVPIVPMRFQITNFLEIRYWDKRKWPLPFSAIKVEYGEPIQITEDNFEKAFDIISKSLR
jgi:lysophospholipid acyltransferase (LPLAT)-like uncharacterized protein